MDSNEGFIEEALTEDGINYIVGRLLVNANEALAESRDNKSDLFAAGRAEAYRQMIDILRTELRIPERDLEMCGLDVNLARDDTG